MPTLVRTAAARDQAPAARPARRPRAAPGPRRRGSTPRCRGAPPDARQRRRRAGARPRWSATGSPGDRPRPRGWPSTRPTTTRRASGATSPRRSARRRRGWTTRRVGALAGAGRHARGRPLGAAQRGRRAAGARRCIALDDYHAHHRARRSTSRSPSWCRTCPRRLRLVMTTRSRPADRRSRGCGRAATWPSCAPTDLRFDDGEAAALLGDAIGHDLEDDEVAAPARAHRGLGRRALPGGPVAARPRRRAGVHRRLRRRRPAGGGLPRRRGARGPAPGAAAVPAAHLDPRPAHRPALRRGGGDGRRGAHAWPSSSARTSSWCPSTAAASGTATTTSSASCCATSWRLSAPGRGRRSCIAARPAGTWRTARWTRRSTTPPPRATSTAPPT